MTSSNAASEVVASSSTTFVSYGGCNSTTRARGGTLDRKYKAQRGMYKWTNKPGHARGAWGVIVTLLLGLHAHEGKPQ
jgi:hypothetical protein